MEAVQPEPLVYEYIVTLHLLKALERDRLALAGLKLGRAWEPFADLLCRAAESAHVAVKRKLRGAGCRIVQEEMLSNRTVQVMYVVKGYEYHCRMMPMVLKARCEEKLREMLKTFEANATLSAKPSIN